MHEEISRYVKPEAERKLWGLAAARCQFNGCNRLVYKSSVTQENANMAEKAHIYSFSEDGPRGRGPYKSNPATLNDVPNLLLACFECHQKMDQDKDGSRYSAELLLLWKKNHEERIRIVTEVDPCKKSHVVLYGARIGMESSPLRWDAASHAMFPAWYPADDRALTLSMACSHDDSLPEFWLTEASHLRREFEKHIRSRMEEGNPNHFSIFARAPQPLLMLLGTLLTDKVPGMVYQLHREPTSWQWQSHPDDFEFIVQEPTDKSGTPALVLALSAEVDPSRITQVLSGPVSIWQVTTNDCHNDMLRSEAQLISFRQTMRKLLVRMKSAHPSATHFHVFPVMPVSCAVELGRIRAPKADTPWLVYDQNNKQGRFIEAFMIGADK